MDAPVREQLSHRLGRNIGLQDLFPRTKYLGGPVSKIINIGVVIAAVTLSATGVFAAPCNVGTTTNMAGASKDTSSNVDGGTTAKVSPGAKSESPGTVGALNNVGAASMKNDGSKKAPEGQPVKPGADNC
ncbi:hypothetical protein MKK65_00725 [Methylobacterium sp. J-001]|uniref:hypothetical protein n=1 Tax=Methylobacterium sp. J-001 TaxID=2836609 RepID=UPI001FBA0EED|nr:hypothetical protein [Methylobacterium sp. J-001]MCJ2115135.1 hypothetical protein [Methylobacterium sp. J-001]